MSASFTNGSLPRDGSILESNSFPSSHLHWTIPSICTSPSRRLNRNPRARSKNTTDQSEHHVAPKRNYRAHSENIDDESEHHPALKRKPGRRRAAGSTARPRSRRQRDSTSAGEAKPGRKARDKTASRNHRAVTRAHPIDTLVNVWATGEVCLPREGSTVGCQVCKEERVFVVGVTKITPDGGAMCRWCSEIFPQYTDFASVKDAKALVDHPFETFMAAANVISEEADAAIFADSSKLWRPRIWGDG